jgi:hypothetical protein
MASAQLCGDRAVGICHLEEDLAGRDLEVAEADTIAAVGIEPVLAPQDRLRAGSAARGPDGPATAVRRSRPHSPRLERARSHGLRHLTAQRLLERLFDARTEDRNWRRGAEGEERVAAYLASLGQRWAVVHDLTIARKGANLDHLVIGPPGVFALNTKNLTGKLTVYEHAILQNGVTPRDGRLAPFSTGEWPPLSGARVNFCSLPACGVQRRGHRDAVPTHEICSRAW